MCTVVLCLCPIIGYHDSSATNCPDLTIVFARGSGAEVGTNIDYLEFMKTIENKLKTTELNYNFIDLNYPAIGVGIENFDVLIGAIVGSGEAFKFGESINTGINELIQLINNNVCVNTKYVLGGYSQGAIVISKALKQINADKIIYAATFGDPKLYLPEGAGPLPAACSGNRLSDYRLYVPDCRAYNGILGGLNPYEEPEYTGKLGTWCNKKDIMCSSYLSISDHISYVSDSLYEDASKIVFDKIAEYFNIVNTVTSPHDTAILIDSTGSMNKMIMSFKEKALKFAEETIENDGRIALYDYRDLYNNYEPKARCDFSSCTIERFEEELNNIITDDGGDGPESLLSASFKVLSELEWRFGATKSLVILTDADYHSPDIDGKTVDDVVALSKCIDPVNFYIITTPDVKNAYFELANRTDGRIETDLSEIDTLMGFIKSRFDSLPRVEDIKSSDVLPAINSLSYEVYDDNSVLINYRTDAEKVLLSVDDYILGATQNKEIIIKDLSVGRHILALAPVNNNSRGETKTIEVAIDGKIIVPGVPNTGKK
jgi:hypothetical protein